MSLRGLPGIGPARATALAEAGFTTVDQVLWHLPRCLDAAPDECLDGALPRGVPVQVRARLERVAKRFARGRGRRGMVLEAVCQRSNGDPLRCRFFNAGWMADRLLPGEWFLFEGRSDTRQANTLNQPKFTHLAAGDHEATAARSGCEVAYQLPGGFGEAAWRRLINHCLEHHLDDQSDPAGVLSQRNWQASLRAGHRPETADEHEAARRVLAERELLALAWWLSNRRAELTAGRGHAWRWTDTVHQRALDRLPFALTAGQQAALAEIRHDAQQPQPMYRLLQGDVGSGKTALALVSALAVIADRGQVLLLAPTAILAAQHAAFCERCLAGSRVRLAVLTGGTKAAERSRLLAALERHELDLVIGTHALLEDDVAPAALGLVIIDEQHKFGVAQRARLVAKAGPERPPPDCLFLTATPIPRSLALTVFGDLAVSTISERPPGRGQVTTTVVGTRAEVDAAITRHLEQGGRGFIVCPRREVDDPDAAGQAPSATLVWHQLQATWGAECVALVHGGLDEAAKLAALTSFASGPSRLLVATSVIEVGVDCPDATLIAVLGAERFGLAQLHQLRGRIGRGHHDGEAILCSADAGARERLQVLADTDDGFTIAEADLAQRGPGDVLGDRQHGLPALRLADLTRDMDLLHAAHQRARACRQAGQSMPTALTAMLPSQATTMNAG